MCVHISTSTHTECLSGIKIRAKYCLNSVDLFLFTESIKLIERLFHSIQPMNIYNTVRLFTFMIEVYED